MDTQIESGECVQWFTKQLSEAMLNTNIQNKCGFKKKTLRIIRYKLPCIHANLEHLYTQNNNTHFPRNHLSLRTSEWCSCPQEENRERWGIKEKILKRDKRSALLLMIILIIRK